MNTQANPLVPQNHAPTPLADRILDAFPSGSYALSALLRLMDIVESTSVPTAAVECRAQPRMLINPEFVAVHAHTPEKLLMLVMHELHHVLLGHTTLFPRLTLAQNFVFDAVINGIVCRMFPGADHTSFFTDYYDQASFPHCLLRPPPDWPGQRGIEGRDHGWADPGGVGTAAGILALREPLRSLAKELHEALYSAAGASYQEVFDALPKLLVDAALGGVPLLGGHGDEALPDGRLEYHSPVLFEVVREIVEQWPQPPDPIRGRSLADVLHPTNIQPRRKPANRTVLRRLICQVAGSKQAGIMRRQRVDYVQAPTPLPSLGRRSMVLRALGHTPLLHTGPALWRSRVDSGERVHVYLDVSGSMDSVKGPLYGAVLDCEALVHPTVHLFSTAVASVSLAQLRQGVCRSSGGTSIDCVAEHMAKHRVRRALLITDGYVGKACGQHQRTLASARLAVAYLGTNTTQQDLESVTNHSATLQLGE